MKWDNIKDETMIYELECPRESNVLLPVEFLRVPCAGCNMVDWSNGTSNKSYSTSSLDCTHTCWHNMYGAAIWLHHSAGSLDPTHATPAFTFKIYKLYRIYVIAWSAFLSKQWRNWQSVKLNGTGKFRDLEYDRYHWWGFRQVQISVAYGWRMSRWKYEPIG